MANKFYATSRIVVGNSDGERTTYAEGEEVSKSDFTDEQWDALTRGGSVAESDDFLTDAVATKTADVQALAQNRQRGNDQYPEQEEPASPDELDEGAKEATEKEETIRKETSEISGSVRKQIAKLPAHRQRNAITRAQKDAAEEKLSGSSKKASTKSDGGDKS